MNKLLEPVIFDDKNIIWDYKVCCDKGFKDYYHWHQCCEVLFVHEGQGTIILNKQSHAIKGGMLFFFQPFQLHHVHAIVSSETPYIRSIFYVDPLLIERLLRQFPKRHALFSALWQKENQSNVFDLSKQIDNMEWIYCSFNKNNQVMTYDNEELTFLFLQILGEINSSCEENNTVLELSPTQRNGRYSEKIMHWIDTHYKEAVTLERLAKETHLSISYISRIFHRETGSNITDYVSARRIKEACLLLKTTDLSIEQIGIQVGVSNASYFNQLFRNFIGMTPLKYRNDRGR